MAETHIVGCILGTAVGDAIGLPYEGLSRRRAAKLLGQPDRHRFFYGHRNRYRTTACAGDGDRGKGTLLTC
jgi:ADP-ribosylglycohydrolase